MRMRRSRGRSGFVDEEVEGRVSVSREQQQGDVMSSSLTIWVQQHLRREEVRERISVVFSVIFSLGSWSCLESGVEGRLWVRSG